MLQRLSAPVDAYWCANVLHALWYLYSGPLMVGGDEHVGIDGSSRTGCLGPAIAARGDAHDAKEATYLAYTVYGNPYTKLGH